MLNVAINGLGRIGRATLKIVLDKPNLRLTAVNDLLEADNLAYLLKFDTVYGRWTRAVGAHENVLNIDGKNYPVLREREPAKLPWRQMGVDVVFECTGAFRERDNLAKHIEAGARFVILSAPAKGEDIPTVIHAVNGLSGHPSQIVSCASCTTNCITPVVEIMARRIGVRKATMTTIHAYTANQSIVDSGSKDFRRGRAGAANLVPASTGAAVATTRALPEFRGKFDGVAVRAPVPVGSLADIVFIADRTTSVDEVNRLFREEAASDRYREVLAVTEEPIVSSDIIQQAYASIVDLSMTQVVDKDLVKVMSWYDNEWGYANQMVRESLQFSGRDSQPKDPG
ncbi:MAG: glyceraldehyde-3-phosphate dehydrogenase, type [Bryobacterales bacterium]|nr:glyceraldehyde-3-phosphate dehydrogenase, type [Bryobacterales bacterium]